MILRPVPQTRFEAIRFIAKDQTPSEVQRPLADFLAEEGEIQRYSHLNDSGWFLGLGEKPDAHTLRRVVRQFVHAYKTKLNDLGIMMPDGSLIEEKSALQAITEGIFLGLYDLGHWKTDPKKKSLAHIELVVPDVASAHASIALGQILAEATLSGMALINAPGNQLTPKHLAGNALQLANKTGFTTEIYTGDALKDMGLGGLVAVNAGSHHAAHFIIARYEPENATKTLGLVGKGVTFDTGGLNLKPSENMYMMKCDMGGAAIVLSAISAIAAAKLPIRVLVAIPATENKTGSNATLPGDVITLYNGKTVEVEDTDAEGRLILADALAYLVKNYETDYLLDFATLTGSCVMALGYHAAGLFTPNDALAAQLSESGETSGDRLWRLPLWEVYKKQIQSDIADLKNLGGRPAGAITAAKFLEAFTDQHPAWAHIDVAGTVYGDGPFGKMRHATGYGTRLVFDFAQRLAETPA
ncbi:MAG: leucyl aminopeptidase family protein [Bacteroidetes Order II. Incertae sedis bacterium]|nr:leucyl aminopeptidase family protein [Bacteroidetes Order II. bacterium]